MPFSAPLCPLKSKQKAPLLLQLSLPQPVIVTTKVCRYCMNWFSSRVYREYNPQISKEKGLSENKKGLCFHTLIFDYTQQLGRVF